MRFKKEILPLKNKYLFLRHGQTKYNLEKRYMGRIDEPLTNKGMQEAKDILLDINIDLMYCSTLIRANQTAEIIKDKYNINIIQDERLVEKNGGLTEGLHYEKIENDYPNTWKIWERKGLKETITTPFPEGESDLDVIMRIQDLITEIESKYKNMNILFVSHHGVLIALRYLFGYTKKEIYEGNIKNCYLEILN